MTGDPSSGPRIKIQRAEKHIYELEAEIGQFLGSNPYSVFVEDDPDSGGKVSRFRVHKEPPPRLSAISGDAIHNLRSSLDLLVNQLVLVNGAEPGDKTAFPIGWTAKDYKAKAPGVTKGISGTAKEMIDALEPYKGGQGDALWRLHRLDISDKHRLLLAVGAAQRNLILRSPAMGEFPAGALAIALKPSNRQFPLKDGDEVAGVVRAASTGNAQDPDDPQFTFEIALNEPGVVEGEAVLPALHELADLVKGIVAAFGPLLA